MYETGKPTRPVAESMHISMISTNYWSFYVPIYSNIILEAGYLSASGQVSFDKETIAEKVSLIVLG